jgi:hypothetical protein
MSLRQTQNNSYTLRFPDGTSVRELELDSECAHLRLLAELCERTVPWVFYSLGGSCSDVYLGHSDGRIRRLAELYNQRMELEYVGS